MDKLCLHKIGPDKSDQNCRVPFLFQLALNLMNTSGLSLSLYRAHPGLDLIFLLQLALLFYDLTLKVAVHTDHRTLPTLAPRLAVTILRQVEVDDGPPPARDVHELVVEGLGARDQLVIVVEGRVRLVAIQELDQIGLDYVGAVEELVVGEGKVLEALGVAVLEANVDVAVVAVVEANVVVEEYVLVVAVVQVDPQRLARRAQVVISFEKLVVIPDRVYTFSSRD